MNGETREREPSQEESELEETIGNVQEVFNLNPELSEIGSQEQYIEYLKTIFPESKVKNIVWHGTEKGDIDKFKTKGSGDKVGKLGAMAGSLKAATLKSGRQDQSWLREEQRTPISKDSRLYSMRFNITKPKLVETLEDATLLKREALETDYDGVIIRGMSLMNKKGRKFEFPVETGYGDEYVVFHEDQIYVLGSKEDLLKFKEFLKEK